ncbi:MAG: hypothetical protein ACJAR6_000291 [Oleispira sp.]|jgi:hypothetical protein
MCYTKVLLEVMLKRNKGNDYVTLRKFLLKMSHSCIY